MRFPRSTSAGDESASVGAGVKWQGEGDRSVSAGLCYRPLLMLWPSYRGAVRQKSTPSGVCVNLLSGDGEDSVLCFLIISGKTVIHHTWTGDADEMDPIDPS